MSKKVTIISPLYNEELNIIVFYQEVKKIVDHIDGYSFDFLFVDDGSKDKTAIVLDNLAVKNSDVKYLIFGRNFGKDIAISAAIENIDDVDCIIVMDGDLQHPPQYINQMINEWNNGYKVVSGIRKSTEKSGFIRKSGSIVFYKIMNLISDTKVLNGITDFRLIDKQVLVEYRKFTERNRLFRGLIDWMQFDTAYVYFDAPARINGESSFNLFSLIKLAISSMTNFSLFPLKLIGYFGSIVSFIFGLLLIVMVTDRFILGFEHFSPLSFVVVVNTFLIGILASGLGLMAIYIGNIHKELQGRPLYILKEKKL